MHCMDQYHIKPITLGTVPYTVIAYLDINITNFIIKAYIGVCKCYLNSNMI